MPLFEYEAKTSKGLSVKGTMDAIDEKAVMNTLRQNQYYPIAIKPYKKLMSMEVSDMMPLKLKDIAIFCRQFSFILTSGINILRAIEISRAQTENKKLRGILNKVYDEVQKGTSLSAALRSHNDFPDMLVSMIETGEVSGTLDQVMLRMAEYYDKEYKQAQKIKSAMTYPTFIGVMAIGVVILLVVKVIPTFAEMITSEGGEMPLPTRIIMGLSNFLTEYGVVLLLILIAIAFGLYLFIKTNGQVQDAIDRGKLKIPIIGKILRQIITARFARTFGMLMQTGVPIIQSLEICGNVLGNRIVKDLLLSCVDEIRKGGSLGMALDIKKMFPPMLTNMIRIGEESGTLDSVLKKTAEFYDGEVEVATQRLTSLIEPVIMVFLAVIIGFIVAAIILPMFSMYNNMNNSV